MHKVLRRSNPPQMQSRPLTRRRMFALAALAIAAALLVQPGYSKETGWKAGAAKLEITPASPIWLAGYAARTKPAEGTLHPLWVKALALQPAGGKQAVVVTSDLLGFTRTMGSNIALEVSRRYSIDRSRIVLSSSHTHSGPVISGGLRDIYPYDDRQQEAIDQYSRQLEAKVVEVVGMAISRLAPAELSSGQGVATFAVNRRNNREPEVPEMRARGIPLKGPSDHAVPVLAVRDAGGRLIAVLFGYACHATTLDSYVWSGDYPGVAQQALEAGHPGAVALFHAGCGADQNPIPRRTAALVEKYGAALAEAVDAVLKDSMQPLAPRLRAAFKSADLKVQRIPAVDELKKIESAPNTAAYRKRWAERVRHSIEAGDKLERSYPYPVQVWRLGGRQLWIVLGGEVVVDYALRFKKEYGPDTWVTGYSNDVMAYIPSVRIQTEGGYESGAMDVYGLPGTGWASDVEEKIAKTVRSLVQRVR